MKALVVDDIKSIRWLVKEFLGALGLETVEASDGLQAVSMALQETPDLVILDMNMPWLNGSQVLKRIRENPSTRDTPVILLTADASEHLVKLVIQQGATDYIVKPFNRDVFLRKVAAALKQRKPAPEGLVPNVARLSEVKPESRSLT
jgi:DNA-binding response OmpR family regulator